MEPDPIASASEGLGRAVIKESVEAIKSLAKKFQNRDLAFLDGALIDVVKDERKTSEYEYVSPLIKDKDMRIIIETGLALRRVDKQPYLGEEKPELKRLRDAIFKRYGHHGLHLAQIVQHGLLFRYIALRAENGMVNREQLTEDVDGLLKDVEKYALFITDEVTPRPLSKMITQRISNMPNGMIIFSRGRKANSTADQTIYLVKQFVDANRLGYRFENQYNEQLRQQYDFILRVY